MINALSNSLQSSLTGMMNATKKLDTAAQNIANASNEGPTVNVDQEMINTLAAKNDFEANAVVLSRTNQMQKALGQILDETA